MKIIQSITFKRKLVYVAVASCFTVMPAYANPSGATVVSGSVSFAAQNNTLTITNTPNAIINWQQFGIQAGEVTRFIQQSAQSAVLNRVVGQNPSEILGSLLSNGRVFLINPNGIVFGQNATVDVAGLVASTLKLSNGDFIAGKLNFTDGVGAGSVVNQGSITTATGGNVYLIAPDIQNSGIITSPQGEILLAAGHTVNLMDVGNPDVQVTVNAPATHAVNLGTLMAQSGRIGIHAALIDQSGVINADTAVRDQNGIIHLKASQNITLEPGSLTTASGMAGAVRDGGEIRIIADGTLNMRKDSQVHVDGGVDGGNGGFLELSGKTKIALRGNYTGRAYQAGYKAGRLLLDPYDIIIDNTANYMGSSASPTSSLVVNAGSGSAASVLHINHNMTLTNSTDGSPVAAAWTDIFLAATHDVTVAASIADTDVPVGGSLTLTAGHDINIDANIGTSGARFDHDLTMNAGGLIAIRDNIYLASNTLTLAGGDVVIGDQGSGNALNVSTLGNMVVTGRDFKVLDGGEGAPTDVTVGGDLTATMSRSVVVEAHEGAANGLSNYVKVQANNIDITAQDLLVQGGITYSDGVAYAEMHANNDITLNISSGITVQGGTVNFNSGDYGNSAQAYAWIGAGHNVVVNAPVSAVSVRAGEINQASSYAYAVRADATAGISGDNVTINAASLTLTGGTVSALDSHANAMYAYAELSAQSGDVVINTSGAVSLAGGTAHMNSHHGSADVSTRMSASQDITITSSSLTVSGGTATAVNNHNIAHADAVITAGSEVRVITSGHVYVDEGITGAVGDAVVSATARIEASPDTIYLTFTTLACCGYFINGVNGATLSTPTIGSTGFFNFSSPAILNDNMFVTYLGASGLPVPVTTAVNFGAGETNGSTNLDGLIEGIRYGEEGDEDNGKPECS